MADRGREANQLTTAASYLGDPGREGESFVRTGDNAFVFFAGGTYRLAGGAAGPTGPQGPTGPPGLGVLTTVEVNLLAAPYARRSGAFTIPASGLTAGKAVNIQQAVGPYTGKGTRWDEAEMDQMLVTGKVLNASTIQCYWKSEHLVRGNFKFDYVVSV